ncbi:winged helix-turn-helix domain-containing protein [Haliangium sp.]|uniref:winged helix-turn-helix domain-containing protein n=1 Tax=Haliangium sp. TaxID=2663208 RepID=UPI003D125381
MSTLAAVEEILRETQVPMSVRQIVEHAAGRLPTKSKTPDTVVARDLSMDIKKKGEASLFIRTAPGRYTLRELHLRDLAADAERADHGNGASKRSEERAGERALGIGDGTTLGVASVMKQERAAPLAAKHSSAAGQVDSSHR